MQLDYSQWAGSNPGLVVPADSELQSGLLNAKFNGRIYRPTKFSEGLQAGPVDWELNRRKQKAKDHAEDKQWAVIQANVRQSRGHSVVVFDRS